MFFTGSRSGTMNMLSPSQISRSAFAPGAIRPRSSRPSAFAPPRVVALKTSAAVAISVWRSTILLTAAVQRSASIMLCGAVSVPGEALHRDPAPRKDPDAVRDVRGGVCQDADVVCLVVRPAPAAGDDRVTENDVRAEEPDLLEPFDRRHPVAADHLVELGHRLRSMEGD